MNRLKVILPGLLGSFPGEVPAHIKQQLAEPVFKELSRWLSRAEVTGAQAQSYYATLYQEICPDCELSVCELTAQYDAIDTTQGFYYRADPVHFKAESDHAILLGSQLIEPALDEARQLIAAFNTHFAEDNISLSLGDAGRWYLQCQKPLQLEFFALDYSLGRDVKHFMPQGQDSLWWRRIVNEAQMLFFQHAVNQQREENRQLTINSLWLWDLSCVLPAAPSATLPAELSGGTADEKTANSSLTTNSAELVGSLLQQIYADDKFCAAVAKQVDVSLCSVDDFLLTHTVNEQSVLVADQLYEAVCYGDITAWIDDLQTFCETTFSHIEQLLTSGALDEVKFYTCDGRVFTINRWVLRKLWKPIKTLERFITVSH